MFHSVGLINLKNNKESINIEINGTMAFPGSRCISLGALSKSFTKSAPQPSFRVPICLTILICTGFEGKCFESLCSLANKRFVICLWFEDLNRCS